MNESIVREILEAILAEQKATRKSVEKIASDVMQAAEELVADVPEEEPEESDQFLEFLNGLVNGRFVPINNIEGLKRELSETEEQKTHCPRCGNHINEDYNFCTICGKDLRGE